MFLVVIAVMCCMHFLMKGVAELRPRLGPLSMSGAILDWLLPDGRPRWEQREFPVNRYPVALGIGDMLQLTTSDGRKLRRMITRGVTIRSFDEGCRFVMQGDV